MTDLAATCTDDPATDSAVDGATAATVTVTVTVTETTTVPAPAA